MSEVDVDRGARCFDDGRYYEAHERWEEEWMDSSGSDRKLLQALVQAAAAYVHLYRGNPEAVASLSTSSNSYLEDLPSSHGGVDVSELMELNDEVEERARQKLESDGWVPLILRRPEIPRTTPG